MAEKVIKALSFPAVKPEHADKWVAVSKENGKLITVGDSLREVLTKSSSTKEKTVFRVLPQVFVGGSV